MADLQTDWWTTQDVASFLDVSPSTVRAYVARDQMPSPDRRMGADAAVAAEHRSAAAHSTTRTTDTPPVAN